MYYIIYALDRPDAGDLRIKTRAAHREYLHRPDLPVRLVLAGPLLADDAVTIIGPVIVVAADSRSQDEAFSAADHYRHAGLVGSVRIELWNWTTGKHESEPAQCPSNSLPGAHRTAEKYKSEAHTYELKSLMPNSYAVFS